MCLPTEISKHIATLREHRATYIANTDEGRDHQGQVSFLKHSEGNGEGE